VQLLEKAAVQSVHVETSCTCAYCMLVRCVSVRCFSAHDRHDWQSSPRCEQLHRQLNTVNAATISSPAQLVCSVYLQICNYLSPSASHSCFLCGSLQSICLWIAFECHFGIVLLLHVTMHACMRAVAWRASARAQQPEGDGALGGR